MSLAWPGSPGRRSTSCSAPGPGCSTRSRRICGLGLVWRDLTEAVASPDVREHLRGGFAAASRMFAADVEIYRVLFAMDKLDPESVGGAVRKHEAERSGGMAHLARRLNESGELRDDVSADHAERVLWVLASFESFDSLYTGLGLPIDDVVEVLVTTAERALCRPAPRRGRQVHRAARRAARTRARKR